jgi:hypothetical protein
MARLIELDAPLCGVLDHAGFGAIEPRAARGEGLDRPSRPGLSAIPVAPPPHSSGIETIASLSARGVIPRYDARRGLLAWHSLLVSMAPVVVFVVCYPKRLRAAELDLEGVEFVNVHPSLLPHFRGPAPVFWQFWAGEVQTGVTLHRVATTLDSGAILRSRARALDPALGIEATERCLGCSGAELAMQLLDGPIPSGRAQDERQASYFGQISPSALRIESRWSVSRVERFIRGTRELGLGYEVHHELGIAKVHDLAAAACAGDVVSIRFADGDRSFRLAHDASAKMIESPTRFVPNSYQ